MVDVVAGAIVALVTCVPLGMIVVSSRKLRDPYYWKRKRPNDHKRKQGKR